MYTSPMTEKHEPPGHPEQTFFNDPALDRVFAVVMGLATEVQVLAAKVSAMEMALQKAGTSFDWDGWRNDPVLAARLDGERKEFVQYLLDPLLGQQKSRGAA